MAFIPSIAVRLGLVGGHAHCVRNERKKKVWAAVTPRLLRTFSRQNKWVMCSSPTTEDETSANASSSSRSFPSESNLTSVDSGEETAQNENVLDVISKLPKQRYGVGMLYLGFAIYSFFFAPGDFRNSAQLNAILSMDLNNVNPLFFAIFNILGATGINYAVALNGGAPRQPRWLPTRVFTLVSVFVGWIAAGPYVTLRRYVPQISMEEVRSFGFLSRLFETRWFSLGTLAICVYSYAYAFGLFVTGSETLHDLMFFSSVVELFRLIQSDRVVHVSCVDFVFLSTLFWGPLTEDMRRRGWFAPGKNVESILTAAIIMSTPALGPSLYFVLRPALSDNQT